MRKISARYGPDDFELGADLRESITIADIGDHSIGFPTTRAVVAHLNGRNLGIIHFEYLVQTGIGGWRAPWPGGNPPASTWSSARRRMTTRRSPR